MAGIQLVKCPRCGSPMTKRSGKYGEFYGCSTYPKCTATIDARDAAKQAQQAVAPTKKFVPSGYQTAVFDAVKAGNRNIQIRALAGSGKTTTLVQLMNIIPRKATTKIVFVAYNKHIQEELARRAPAGVTVVTCHSLGFKALRNGLPIKPEVDDGKLMGIIKEFLPNYEQEGHLRAPLAQLVSLAKNTLTDPEDLTALGEMAVRYGVDLNGDMDRLLNLVAPVISVCASRLTVIDYDDMIWLPIRLNLHLETFDWVLGDEFQDMNACMIELIMRSIKPETGRAIVVGDVHQSIYGFRGADVEAMDKAESRLNAERLPLNICYRCPKSHIDLAKEIVPEIEAAEDAIMGTVEHVTYMRAMTAMQDGDLVLCRLNAPLISTCYAFIKMGRKAVIRGRDIGKNLINFIDKLQPTSIVDLVTKVGEYKVHEVERLTAAGKEAAIQSLTDKCDCVMELTDGMRDLSELRLRISTIFDDETKTGIILSSVHRAKGDEAERVWILKPELMPLPRATQEWQIEQEMNIKYVAFTRSKRDLYLVSGAK